MRLQFLMHVNILEFRRRKEIHLKKKPDGYGLIRTHSSSSFCLFPEDVSVQPDSKRAGTEHGEILQLVFLMDRSVRNNFFLSSSSRFLSLPLLEARNQVCRILTDFMLANLNAARVLEATLDILATSRF